MDAPSTLYSMSSGKATIHRVQRGLYYIIVNDQIRAVASTWEQARKGQDRLNASLRRTMPKMRRSYGV